MPMWSASARRSRASRRQWSCAGSDADLAGRANAPAVDGDSDANYAALKGVSPGYGSANVNRPSPAAIVTICLPFTEYVIGFALIVPPRLIFQSSLPLSASSAKK